jgi:hypothetical protein
MMEVLIMLFVYIVAAGVGLGAVARWLLENY